MKRHALETVALGLATLIMLALGAAGLAAPDKIVGSEGISLPGATALNEMRAAYGGQHLGLALFFGLGLLRAPMRRPALALAVLLFGGLLVGRLVSFAIDGSPDAFIFKPLGLESLALVLAVAALVRRAAPTASVSTSQG